MSEEDDEFLWQSRLLGKHSAQALVNVNFKNVTEHFGVRGRQEHYSMMVEDFNIITSPDGAVKYVTFKEGPTKTRQGGLWFAHRAVQPKMFSTGGERCSVMLFEAMLSRRPPEMRQWAILLDNYFKTQKAKYGSADNEWVNTKLDSFRKTWPSNLV